MFDYSLVKKPEFFKENRLEAHSDHKYYKDMEHLRAGDDSFRHSLNGLWKFAYAVNYQSSVKGFEKAEFDCRGWEDIVVPAHIQMEGYDRPQYVNTQYPWEGSEEVCPGQIPERFNPVANYVKYFYVPENMHDRPVFISFQGVESAMALWCNGSYVGYSEDSFTPSEFELTPFLRQGENKLAVTVFKWCAGSWCEDQDFFRFSGIFRDVYLYTIPEVHIYDIGIKARLEDDLQTGELCLHTRTIGKGRMRGRLLAGDALIGELSGELGAGPGGEDSFSLPVKAPVPWSAEFPFLYTLLLTVEDANGRLQEVAEQKVGFRSFKLRDGIMYLNGRRIVFKGVNRHEFCAESGRVVSRDKLRKDLLTMKRNNINAIRTSHYPNASDIYAMCDELGLYMIDECNLETHGSMDACKQGLITQEEHIPGSRPEWRELVLDRANSMLQRDKNHPSILMWSCGNESMGGSNLYEMAQLFRRQDDSRLVHYEGIFHDRSYPDTSDVESQMYPSVESIKAFLRENPEKPFICCEYSHAMGNSCGAMHKYTDLTDTEPRYQGGFIWDYIDQSLTVRDRYGKEFQAYGGDFDDRPTDYNFSGNGIVYGGNREASPKMQEVKFNYQNISIEVREKECIITNKHLFVNTDIYACTVRLEKEGRLLEERELRTCVEAGEKAAYPLPVRLPEREGEYAITVSFRLKEAVEWAPAGHEVAFGQGVFRKVIQNAVARTEEEGRAQAERGPKLEVIRSVQNLGVRGENFHVIFSYLNGGLVSYKYGGKELLKTIPRPNFWRAPVDNDTGNRMMGRYAQWKIASMYLTHVHKDAVKPQVEVGSESVSITYTYYMPTTPESHCRVRYEVCEDGTVKVTLTYDPVKELHDMPEYGMILKMDADYENLEWYGNGPEETYSDRQRGARLGLYRNKVTDNMAAYLTPQECGNKTEVRYAKVTDRRGRGLVFTGDRMSFSALPYTPHELENAMHPYELPGIHYTVIRAAAGQMGVGGDDSWGARPHPEYLLNAEERMEFSFSFKGVVPENADSFRVSG